MDVREVKTRGRAQTQRGQGCRKNRVPLTPSRSERDPRCCGSPNHQTVIGPSVPAVSGHGPNNGTLRVGPVSLYIVKADDDDRSLCPSNGPYVAPDSAEVIGDVGGCCEGAIDMRANKSLTC